MKIVLFGTGKLAKRFLEKEESLQYDILAIVDNDENKQGSEIQCGSRTFKVISVNDIFKYDYSMILVVVGSVSYQLDIYGQLIKLGVSSKKIKFLHEWDIVEREIIDLPGKIIKGKCISISLCKIDEKEFFWCGDAMASDPLNECVKTGKLYIGGGLMPIAKHGSGTFLDIGANIGGVCLAFAACGWNGYAIEAAEKNCRLLEKSISLNEFDIKCINKGVWKESGKLYFKEYGPFGTISDEIINGAVEIEVTSLDNLLNFELKCCERIDFIKMDIEGSEIEALVGAEEMLRHFDYPPIFVEANAWTLALVDNKTVMDLKRTAESYGYLIYRWSGGVWKRYSKKTFWDEICTDFLLVHENNIPEYISISQDEYGTLSEEVVARRICKVLGKTVEEWGENGVDGLLYQETVAIACSMRDFPELARRADISFLMKSLIDVSKSDSILSGILRR